MHLAHAEIFVRDGAERVANQNKLIARDKFIAGGRTELLDAQLAKDVLHLLEHSQRLHVAQRDWLRAELASLP